jgi:hypothetical protein
MKSIFDIFSRRNPRKDAGQSHASLTDQFRNRVLLLCRDIFGQTHSGNYLDAFWSDIHRKLQYRHGTSTLTQQRPLHSVRSQDLADDAIGFLLSCQDEYFLDFVEYVFRTKCFRRVSQEENSVVDSINKFFLVDDLPYHLTHFVRETKKEMQFGRQREVSYVTARPRVIRRDNQLIHQNAIEPALELLSKASYSSANKEMLEALEDFRKADYGDCLTKCNSAFESVMKVICHRKGWDYKSKDSAGALISTVTSNSNLDPFFDQPLMLVATIRNRLSNSHGAGIQEKAAPKHIAKFAVNVTASAILLVHEETQ